MSVDTELNLIAGLERLAKLGVVIDFVNISIVEVPWIVFGDDAKINVVLINTPAILEVIADSSSFGKPFQLIAGEGVVAQGKLATFQVDGASATRKMPRKN